MIVIKQNISGAISEQPPSKISVKPIRGGVLIVDDGGIFDDTFDDTFE